MRLRIKSDGKNHIVTSAETGEVLEGVRAVSLVLEGDKLARVTVDLYVDHVDIIADIPRRIPNHERE